MSDTGFISFDFMGSGERRLLTPDEVSAWTIERLTECAEAIDGEQAHVDADDVLCAFVRALGYDNVATAYENVGKW